MNPEKIYVRSNLNWSCGCFVRWNENHWEAVSWRVSPVTGELVFGIASSMYKYWMRFVNEFNPSYPVYEEYNVRDGKAFKTTAIG